MCRWSGTDASEEQIRQAEILSEGMDIDYYAVSAENIYFHENEFDVVTACQCFFYFDHEKLMPKLWHVLKPDGRILVLYMAWLPLEDEIAAASEKLVLKYNPKWSGAGAVSRPILIPKCYEDKFEPVHSEVYRLPVHFTRESWNRRIKACRGIGASLPKEQIELWEEEHMKLLSEIAPAEFDILHYAAMAELKRR